MKYAIRDRYTQALALLVLGLVLYFALQEGKSKLVGIFIAIGGLSYLGWLALSPGRYFPFQKRPEDVIDMKEENSSGFQGDFFDGVDGILFPGGNIGKPFKISNGVDVVVAGSDRPDYGTVREAGPGSWLVNRLNGGGYIEPPDSCWRIRREIRE